jgi:hypothetical protein
MARVTRAGVSEQGRATLIKIQETGWRSEQCGPLGVSQFSKSLVLSRSNEIEIMRHYFLTRPIFHTTTTPLSLRAFATKQSTHWPRIATHHCHRALLQPRITTRTMASIHIDDKVKALINNSYPQTQDAGDDPHKLSASAYPQVEVCSRDMTEIMNRQLTVVTVHPA